MGQIQIAAQHRHIKLLLPEHAAHIGGHAFGQRGVVKVKTRDTFGKRQMNAAEALLPGLASPGFERPLRLRR